MKKILKSIAENWKATVFTFCLCIIIAGVVVEIGTLIRRRGFSGTITQGKTYVLKSDDPFKADTVRVLCIKKKYVQFKYIHYSRKHSSSLESFEGRVDREIKP